MTVKVLTEEEKKERMQQFASARRKKNEKQTALKIERQFRLRGVETFESDVFSHHTDKLGRQWLRCVRGEDIIQFSGSESQVMTIQEKR